MRVGLIGAGAVGCWLGARLADAGHEVSVLARGETLAAIRAHGLRLDEAGRTLAPSVKASDKAEALGPQDLTILAVKAPALAGRCYQCAHHDGRRRRRTAGHERRALVVHGGGRVFVSGR